jgi:hypothetical protein
MADVAGGSNADSESAGSAPPPSSPPPPIGGLDEGTSSSATAPTTAVPTGTGTGAASAPSAAPAAKPAFVRPAPSKKSYLPTFLAPEAYGRKASIVVKSFAQMQKESEENAARAAAKAERDKARRKRKNKGEQGGEMMTEEEAQAVWQLVLMIAFGVLMAFFEALDLDVFLGIVFYPVIKFMQYLSVEFDNVALDPTMWANVTANAYNEMCRESPSAFIYTVFGIFVFFVIFILFQADLAKWWAERNFRAAGYNELGEGDDGPSDESLEKLFKELDANGSGDVSRDEVEGAIFKLFGKVEQKVVEEMMAAADTDGDGEISVDEFKKVMRAGPKGLGALSDVMTDPDAMKVMQRNAKEDLEEVRCRGKGSESA